MRAPVAVLKAAPVRVEPADPLLGQTLNNRFRIESKIGEGGFGAVYRGVQLATGRKVALKLLHPEMTTDANLVARFRREGLVLCNLRDAHTITTYDFDQTADGMLYIAMELLEGKSLHAVFHANPPLEWRRMLRILSAMCSSLAEAHAQGIVHRDLKPENVYLEQRSGNPDFVKILDFGIAKVMRGDTIDPQSAQLTATGQTLGTLEYMSPEQLMGKQLDGRSDVYTLGVVGYEMITGRLPFPDAKGPAGLITAQLKQTPPPPSVANSKLMLPPAVDRLLLKCLEKDRNQRFADVAVMATAINEVFLATTGESVAAHRDSTPVPGSLAPVVLPQGPIGPSRVTPHAAGLPVNAPLGAPRMPVAVAQSSPMATTPGYGPAGALLSGGHSAPPGGYAYGGFPPTAAASLLAPQSFPHGPAPVPGGQAPAEPSTNWFLIALVLLLVGGLAGGALALLL
ncbi:MAG: protein kinase [Kofleriaceae bacterium]|nr:protein kinase [Kofleriaceae bacterium]